MCWLASDGPLHSQRVRPLMPGVCCFCSFLTDIIWGAESDALKGTGVAMNGFKGVQGTVNVRTAA